MNLQGNRSYNVTIETPANWTRALHHRVETQGAAPAVTPLFQNSAFEATSPYFYTRKENPNSREVAEVVALLEGAPYGLAVTTGMTAIHIMMSLYKPGAHVVINDCIYGCSFRYFQRLAARQWIRLTVLDLSKRENIERLPSDVDLVFFETPTNPFLREIDIAAVSSAVRMRNEKALIVVDNTWATPILQKPLDFGADMSIYSATKYFSGHSDVMGGFITMKRSDIFQRLHEERFYTGQILDPHSSWLLRRSLQTLQPRLRAHGETTTAMTAWLKQRPEVARVYAPPLGGQQLMGPAGIIFFEFHKKYDGAYTQFRDQLKIFNTGTGMACVTSMVAQPFSGSHASMSEADRRAMGIDENLVRLSFGMEDLRDLQADLDQAFCCLS